MYVRVLELFVAERDNSPHAGVVFSKCFNRRYVLAGMQYWHVDIFDFVHLFVRLSVSAPTGGGPFMLPCLNFQFLLVSEISALSWNCYYSSFMMVGGACVHVNII